MPKASTLHDLSCAEFPMKKSLLILAMLTLSTTASGGSDYDDPTLENRFSLLHCRTTMREFCSQDFCSDYPGHKDLDYWISLRDRSLGGDPALDAGSRQPLNFTQISQPDPAKILFEKFEFSYRGANKKAMLVYLPEGSGYNIGLAIDTLLPVATTEVLSTKWNGLAIDRWIESGRCETK